MINNSKQNDIFKFERERLGKNNNFGRYLYRNIYNNQLIASHESPYNEKKMKNWDNPESFLLLYNQLPLKQRFTLKQKLFSGSDIGLYADALIYYKNK